MNTIKSLWLLFALISTCSAEACKKICRLDDVNCVTKGGFNAYKTVVYGVKGLIKPMDPLYIGEINGKMQSVKHKLTNITMIGLKNCEVTKLTINVTENTYRRYVHCPKLISHFHFEAKEDSDTPVFRGKGVARVAAYDYDTLTLAKYAVFVNEDHRPHFFIKSHEIRTHLKGKLVFAITKAYIVDSHRANETEQYMNKNWRTTEDFLHKRIVTRAMDILINNMDVYLRKYTMGAVLPQRNK